MYWYGIALRDNDIDHLKNRVCMLNRYPLMDVSFFSNNSAFCKEKHFLCDYFTTTTILSERLPIYARLIFASWRNLRSRNAHASFLKLNFHLQAFERERRRGYFARQKIFRSTKTSIQQWIPGSTIYRKPSVDSKQKIRFEVVCSDKRCWKDRSVPMWRGDSQILYGKCFVYIYSRTTKNRMESTSKTCSCIWQTTAWTKTRTSLSWLETTLQMLIPMQASSYLAQSTKSLQQREETSGYWKNRSKSLQLKQWSR